ncbi:MAG: 50S ribosomal protein L5 [Nitrososphaeraceae archaeon]|nr:50S ribosomal protein L5 [Nitrososphaeraceae archaeon]
MSTEDNIISNMKEISIEKVVINIGVGKSGDPIERAKNALEELTGRKPAVRGARKSIRDFGIHKKEPIGTLVTLRRNDAIDFAKRIFAAKNNILKLSSIDNFGNTSIGIREHIDIPGTKYNPDIGIVGMDVCISLKRPGYRISKRKNKSIVGSSHRISKTEAIKFYNEKFGVEIK